VKDKKAKVVAFIGLLVELLDSHFVGTNYSFD